MVTVIGGVDMSKKSIFTRFLASFLVITSIFLLITGVFFYKYINGYFYNESYKIIKSSQDTNLQLYETFLGKLKYNQLNETEKRLKSNYDQDEANDERIKKKLEYALKLEASPRVLKDKRAVSHTFFWIDDKGKLRWINQLPVAAQKYAGKLIKKIEDNEEYLKKEGNFEYLVGNQTLLYSIGEITKHSETHEKAHWLDNQKIYVVSSMWSRYSKEATSSFFVAYIMLAIVFISVVSLMVGYFSKRMKNKFKELEKNAEKIGNREWEDELILDDKYEFGRLSVIMDSVRLQLNEYDQQQKHQFHAISHELKTPIMVIKGYLDSIVRGLYPKGNLESSLEIVGQETDKLENMVKNILYLNKMDYLSKRKDTISKIEIKPLIQEAVDRFEIVRSELKWDMVLEQMPARGTKEQWTFILDNILSNQVRYAKTRVNIRWQFGELIIENDGRPIEVDLIDKIFEPFHKGIDGQTGLGLSIVKRLLEVNGYKIEVKNQESCVVFRISDSLVND
jgi:two-component system sensor histidine kinase CssS